MTCAQSSYNISTSNCANPGISLSTNDTVKVKEHVTEELLTIKSEVVLRLLKNSASNRKPFTTSSFMRISLMLGSLFEMQARIW